MCACNSWSMHSNWYQGSHWGCPHLSSIRVALGLTAKPDKGQVCAKCKSQFSFGTVLVCLSLCLLSCIHFVSSLRLTAARQLGIIWMILEEMQRVNSEVWLFIDCFVSSYVCVQELCKHEMVILNKQTVGLHLKNNQRYILPDHDNDINAQLNFTCIYRAQTCVPMFPLKGSCLLVCTMSM